jgi:prophage regulatory protein
MQSTIDPRLKGQEIYGPTGCTRRSRASHYERVAAELFTKPVKTEGGQSATWPQSEVAAIMAAEAAGSSDEELRRLVHQLHAKRKALAPRIDPAPATEAVA